MGCQRRVPNASSSAHPRPGGTPAPPPGCCRSRDDGRRTTAAQSLLDSLVGQLDDPFERGLACRAQGAIRYALDETGETASVLLGAAQELAPLDVHQARKALLDALTERGSAPGSPLKEPATSTSHRSQTLCPYRPGRQ